MSVTCQVKELKADRICLHVPGIAMQPETSQFLMQHLLGLAGVAGVEVRPATSSVVILHEGGLRTRAAILDALRGGNGAEKAAAKAAADPAANPAANPADTLPHTESVESGAAAAETVSQDERLAAGEPGQVSERPYARCELLHAMRGRVRLRIPVLRTDPALAGVLTQFMEQQAGVQQVRLNGRAANLIVNFDPAALNAHAIMARVTAYEPDLATIARWEASQVAPHQRPALQRQRRRLELALAGGALVVGFLGGASFALLVYALLLGAVGSILQRTYKSLFKSRRLTVEALSAGAMILLILNGMAWLAALVPILLSGIVWARTRIQARGEGIHAVTRTASSTDVTSIAVVGPVTKVAVLDGAEGDAARPIAPEPAEERGVPVAAHMIGLGAFLSTLVVSIATARRARANALRQTRKARA